MPGPSSFPGSAFPGSAPALAVPVAPGESAVPDVDHLRPSAAA